MYHLLSHMKLWKLPPVIPAGRLGRAILHWHGMLHLSQSYFHTLEMYPSLFIPTNPLSRIPHKITDQAFLLGAEQIALASVSTYLGTFFLSLKALYERCYLDKVLFVLRKKGLVSISVQRTFGVKLGFSNYVKVSSVSHICKILKGLFCLSSKAPRRLLMLLLLTSTFIT